MSLVTQLTVGGRYRFDGDVVTLTGFDGPSVRLRTSTGAQSVVLSAVFIVLAQGEEPEDESAGVGEELLDNLPDAAVEEAKQKAGHILEALTGFKAGDPVLAMPGEPRDEYNVLLEPSKVARFKTKAIELDVSLRTLWYWHDNFNSFGLVGLVDKRVNRLLDPFRSIDKRVKETLLEVVAEQSEKSNITKARYGRLTRLRLEEKYPGEEIAFPPKTTFNRLFQELTKGRGTMGAAKQRRSIANRPKGTYKTFRNEAQRAGQYVLIDSTPLDVFAMDPITFKWMAVELTLALDLFTSSIVAWRFTSGPPRDEDSVLLLSDMIRPRPLLEHWPASAAWRYLGVPENVIVDLGDGAPAAGKPIVRPETVVVDHGKVFTSTAFTLACRRLGISLQYARVLTPTDKSHVERVFRTIRQSFLENLPGYKGPDVWSRGRDIELGAYYFIDEIEDLFAEWVVTYYQQRHHRGLHLESAPTKRLSPNDMYDLSIAKAGFLYVPRNPTLYLELLPVEWLKVHHYGVEVSGLIYDGDGLNGKRNTSSPYRGVHDGKWPIRVDRRDLSKVWFQDPNDNEWHTLEWIGSTNGQRPFSDVELGFAKKQVLAEGGNPKNEDEVGAVLDRMVKNIEADHKNDKRGRRQLIRGVQQAKDAQRDQRDAVEEAHEADPYGELAEARRQEVAFEPFDDIPLLASEDDENDKFADGGYEDVTDE
jgi:transposase InsO family protein